VGHSWRALKGKDLVVVKELLGHATIEMTMRYAHLAPQHTANAVESLTQALAAPVHETETAAVGTREAAPRARSEHAPSGRQSPAKAKYLRDQRLGKWRRGESNPRPKAHPRARLRSLACDLSLAALAPAGWIARDQPAFGFGPRPAGVAGA